MTKIKRLIYLPNNEYENFNLTTLRNSSDYTISAVNCPSLKTFIITAPQRKSYKKDTLVHDVRPDMVFCSNILDISNTKITDLYLYCTTDVYQLRLPATLNNFVCDSSFDIDMKHVTEADFDFIHHDLIEAYTNPDNYFRYVDSISHDIVPTASDGSLIFSMYAPDLNSVEPDLYEWNLYGLKFEEFYTYAMNNNIKLTSDQITMASRYANYGITINNAMIEPTRYPTMFYPTLVNSKSPIIGEIDYKYYIGDDLSYAMAYANKNEVNIIIPTSVIINAKYTHKIDYESEYTYFHPNTVMVYTSLTSGVRPTFNTEFTRYTVNEVQNGDGTYTTTIASSITGDAPKSISFDGATDLYSVEYINTSKLTDMGYMFQNCSNLTSIDTSGWDTSKVTNMGGMFQNCNNLISLNTTNWDTSSVINMSDMFRGCSSLTSLDVSNWDTSGVTSMPSVFFGCSSLTSLDLSGWKTSKVTNMASMFNACSKLTSLDLSGWDTSNIDNMTHMFYGCSNLTSLDLSSWDTSSVTDMGYMFNACSSLTDLDVSGWDTHRVTSMSNMFNNCSSLTSLDVSHFNTPKVYTMSSMFQNCNNLTSLDLSSWNTSMVTNMNAMFQNCRSLASLDVSRFNTSNVISMNAMFNNCIKLTSLDLSNFNTSKVTDTTNMFYDCSKLTSLKWTNWMTSVNLSFTILTSECVKDLVKNLGKNVSEQTLTLNNTLAGYLTKMDMMYATVRGWTITPNLVNVEFANVASSTDLSDVTDATYKICTVELTESNKYTRLNDVVNAYTACNEVYIYDDGSVTGLNDLLNTNNTTAKTKITTFGFIDGYFINNTSTNHMFYNCSNLTSLDLSSFDTSMVTTMTSMFQNCSSLTSLDLSSFDTSMVTNMNAMFYNCAKLSSLDISGFDTSMVTTMTSMFQDCSSLTSLDVNHFDTSMVTNMNGMFEGCSSLTSLDVSGWDTSMVANMWVMFRNCSNLTSLDITNFDTSMVIGMGSMFQGCSKLTSLDLSSFDTSMVTTMTSMFQNCSSLTSLDLSSFDTSMVTNMNAMFYNCAKLSSLDISGFDTSKVTQMYNMFYGCSNLTSLDLSHFDTTMVTNMNGMFTGCSSLTTLDLSSFVTSEKVTTTDMFSRCTGLTNLKWVNWKPTTSLSDSTNLTTECLKDLLDNLATVTTKPTLTLGTINLAKLPTSDILKAQFKGWIINGASTIMILATDTINGDDTTTECAIQLTSDKTGTRIAEVLNAYTSCSKIYLFDDGTVTNLGECIKTAHNNTTTNKPKQVEFLQGYFKNVTNVGGLCRDATSLTYLNLGDIISNKVDGLAFLCSGCSKLETIVIPNIDTSSVTTMYYMFGGCSKLTSLDLRHFNMSKVNTIQSMFNGCSSLISLDLSGWDTSNVTNMAGMFQNCHKLESLDLSSWDTLSVTDMSGMFSSCSSLTSLDASGFDTSSVTTMSSMFSGCSSLVSPPITTFGNNVDYFNIYYGCEAMNTIPTLVINGPCSLYRMFALCHKLPFDITFDWRTNEEVSVTGMFVDSRAPITSLYGINLTSCGKTFLTGFFFGGIGGTTKTEFKNLTCTGILSNSLTINSLPNLTKDSLMQVINCLCDNGDGLTLTMGTSNIAKLTESEISAITAKGWTLA